MVDDSSAQDGLGRRLLRSAAHYSAGQGVSMLASIARIAVSARVLSAQSNGVWLGLQLVLSYGSYLHMGAPFGMFRSVPMARASGREDDARREVETCMTFVAIVSVVSAPVLYLLTRLLYPSALSRQAAGTVVLVLLTLVKSHYNSALKAESKFSSIAFASGAGGVVSLLGLLLIVRYGLDGLIAATAIQTFVETALNVRDAGVPKLRLSHRVLVEQIKVGAATVLTSLGVLVLTTIDRTVMLHRLGPGAAGLYYIGANVMVLMPIVAALPAAVLTPQFFERVGRGEDVLPLVIRPIRIASLLFAALTTVGSVMLGPVTALLWPRLSEGVPAAIIATFATYPLVLAGLASNVYYAHNRQFVHVGILLAASAVGFGLAHAGVTLRHDITGAAAGSCLGLYAYFPMCVVGAFAVVGRWREGARLVLSVAPPILYAAALVAGSLAAARFLGPGTVQRALWVFGAPVLGLLPLAVRLRRELSQWRTTTG